MAHPLIKITDLSASYDRKTVLSHVNLTVYEHDFLGIIGPNGGGKTTLVKSILGLHQPDEGEIKWGITTSQSYFPNDNSEYFDGKDLTLVECFCFIA